MTPFKAGDVVSVEFPFSDFQTYKRRPGLVLVSGEMDLLVACLTTHPPREPSLVVQIGREENLELVCCTQLPHKVNASITGQSTELVCFRLGEPLALNRVKELGASATKIERLPLGKWISWNRLSGAKLAGKVF
jgi:hypothetical protein